MDELGVEIPESQYAVAKKEIFGERWTVDLEEFLEWFTETEAVAATDTTEAIEAKPLTPFALAVREAIIKNRPEEEFQEESESEEEHPQDKQKKPQQRQPRLQTQRILTQRGGQTGR